MIKAVKTNVNQKAECLFHDFLDIALVAYFDLGFGAYAVNEDCSVGALIYGKIFGFKHNLGLLKSRGHVFKDDDNDAEFIVHAYKELGNNAFCDLWHPSTLVLGATKRLSRDAFRYKHS
jgi:hypothetical protein